MWLLARGCGFDMSIGHAVGLVGILALGILMPAGPGLFGNFQLAVALGLKLFFPESVVLERASAYIFILYSIQMLVLVTTGVIPLLVTDLKFRDIFRVKTGSQNAVDARVFE